MAAGLRVAVVSNVSLVAVAATIGVPELGQLFTIGFQLAYFVPIGIGIVLCVALAMVLESGADPAEVQRIPATGRLLIVAHAQMPSWADPAKHPAQPGLDKTLAALALPDDEWTVETRREIVHAITSKAGEDGTRSDIVLRLRRA